MDFNQTNTDETFTYHFLTWKEKTESFYDDDKNANNNTEDDQEDFLYAAMLPSHFIPIIYTTSRAKLEKEMRNAIGAVILYTIDEFNEETYKKYMPADITDEQEAIDVAMKNCWKYYQDPYRQPYDIDFVEVSVVFDDNMKNDIYCLTYEEAAVILEISEENIDDLIASGELNVLFSSEGEKCIDLRSIALSDILG